MIKTDEYFMQKALQLARQAEQLGEVPVGALLVQDETIIAKAWNQPIAKCDPTAHAEINVLRQAGERLKNYRLNNTTLYVTLEPCAMCAAAMVHARIKRLVFAAFDPKTGAAGSVVNLLQHSSINHCVEISGGICETEAKTLLQDFFKKRR